MIVKHEAGADNAVNKQVYDVLRRNLMIGHFKPGQPVSIRYLTETLGVSATCLLYTSPSPRDRG